MAHKGCLVEVCTIAVVQGGRDIVASSDVAIVNWRICQTIVDAISQRRRKTKGSSDFSRIERMDILESRAIRSSNVVSNKSPRIDLGKN